MVKSRKDEDYFTDSYTSSEDFDSYETVVKRSSEQAQPLSIFRCCTRPRTRSEAVRRRPSAMLLLARVVSSLPATHAGTRCLNCFRSATEVVDSRVALQRKATFSYKLDCSAI